MNRRDFLKGAAVALSAAALPGMGRFTLPDDRGLRFRSDGSFKILQFTDTHLHYPDERDPGTYELMSRLIDIERPDLIYLTGDIARHTDEPAEVQTWPRVVEFFDSKGIPWAFVFGNHDPEVMGYAWIEQLLAESTHSVYESGPAEINGYGNYALPVYGRDRQVHALLWGFDSGMGSDEPSGYDWIQEDQIEWFRQEHERLTTGKADEITNLAFFHIPVVQYKTIWDTQTCTGSKYERVCYQGRDIGQYGAFKGRVSACFVGHDHVNDYSGTLDGFDMLYGRASGYRGYGREGFPRGGRVIVVREDTKGYTSHIRLDDGTIAEQPVHQPEQQTG